MLRLRLWFGNFYHTHGPFNLNRVKFRLTFVWIEVEVTSSHIDPALLPVCLSLCLPVCLSVCPSVCMFVWLTICLSVRLSGGLPLCLYDSMSNCHFLPNNYRTYSHDVCDATWMLPESGYYWNFSIILRMGVGNITGPPG
jgi:hypothetical protein